MNTSTWKSIEKQVHKNLPQHTKTSRKWSKAIAKGYLTENEIIHLRSFFGRGKATKDVKAILMKELTDKLEETGGFPITPEQTLKGITWLRNFLYTKAGKERQTKESQVFGSRERRIIADFKEFKLNSLYNSGNAYHDHYLPLYEVIDTKGNAFGYTTNMGQIEVIY